MISLAGENAQRQKQMSQPNEHKTPETVTEINIYTNEEIIIELDPLDKTPGPVPKLEDQQQAWVDNGPERTSTLEVKEISQTKEPAKNISAIIKPLHRED